MRYFEMPLYDGRPSGTNAGEDRGLMYPERFLTDVQPSAAVYLAPAGSGSMIIICPGGGYRGLSIDKEGHDFARLFSGWGISSMVLSYRMPDHGEPPRPLIDARRAVRLCRKHAGDWKTEPGKLGIMGFSAGGHLALTTALNPVPAQENGRGIDATPVQLDFMVLAYPVVSFRDPMAHIGSRENFIGPDAPRELIDRYSGELHVTPDTPPTFLVHAEDDTAVPVANSIEFARILEKNNVNHELLLHPAGGHGFGMGPRHGYETAPDWCPALRGWFEKLGLITGKPDPYDPPQEERDFMTGAPDDRD